MGTRIAMTPAGQEQVISTVTEFVPEKRYADETPFNGSNPDIPSRV